MSLKKLFRKKLNTIVEIQLCKRVLFEWEEGETNDDIILGNIIVFTHLYEGGKIA